MNLPLAILCFGLVRKVLTFGVWMVAKYVVASYPNGFFWYVVVLLRDTVAHLLRIFL